MALIKNKISVPFAAGLETKTDRSQDQLSGLRVLENVIFDTPKKLLKRKGYSLLDTKLLDNTEIENAKYLADYKNELGLMTDTDYYAYSESLNKWTSKGQVFTAFPESKPILRNNREQKNIDTISVEGINAFIYQDSSGVRLSVVDNANCNFITSDLLVSASGTVPRIVNIQNTMFIFYIDGSDLKFRSVNILNPSTLSSETTVASDVETNDNNMDCVEISEKIFCAYNSTASGGSIRAFTVDISSTVSSIITVVGEDASDGLTVATDCNSRFVVTYSTGSLVKILVYSFTLGVQILAPSTVESIASVTNIAVIETDQTLNEYTLFYEVTAASVKDHFIKKNTIRIDSTLGTPSIVKRSVGIASKPFIQDNIAYLTAVHESSLQSTYFLINGSGTIISRFSPNIGGKIITENVLTKVANPSTDMYLLGSQIKGRTVIDDDNFFSLLGVNSTTINFALSDPFQHETLGENMHIVGGFPMMYDGDRIVEHNFHLFPEDLSDAGNSTVGGVLQDGVYQYAAVYAWTDNRGQIHRSAPSVGFSVTLSGATSTQQQSITVPTLRLTQKENVIIELYRTEAAGTIFYKITDVFSPILNDPTVDSVTIVDDSTSDANIISNEILYTTGGVLDNIMAPANKIIESFSDRIFLAGLEDPNKLQFSKIRFDGAPVEFNDTLTIQVNAKGGDITALKAMDEKLVIFKETALFYISGDGPNNIGQQDTFIKPELISSDIGCININSVVLTPQGLMFKSKKGIYLLSRGMQLQYIGANVERFNDLKISSAVVIPEENQVRFTTEDGEALVYNYFVGQWAAFSNHRALSAVNIGFTYYYLRFDGILYIEDETGYTDNGSPINIDLATGWISFAGVQGFQRVYKLLLLGNFKSPHKIRIRVAYDFNEAFVQEVTINTADFNDNTRYGEYSPYGDPTTIAYGGDGNVHQMRIDLKRQKCQAIKIKIEEIQDDPENYGEGLSLSNVMFEIGQKKGTNKLDTVRKYGTS